MEQPSVAAWVVPPSFSCKMSFLRVFCNFLQGDTAYVKTFFVKLSTYHPKCQNLLAIHSFVDLFPSVVGKSGLVRKG